MHGGDGSRSDAGPGLDARTSGAEAVESTFVTCATDAFSADGKTTAAAASTSTSATSASCSSSCFGSYGCSTAASSFCTASRSAAAIDTTAGTTTARASRLV